MRLVTALWLGMLVIPTAAQDCRNGGVGELMTFSYPMDTGGTMNLRPTALIPEARGNVTLVRKSTMVDIDVRVDDIPPAENLGGGLSTYVVWLVAPDGALRNIGELLMNGNSGILQTTTNWGAFGIIVTAEPNHCVKCPSAVILANEDCVTGLQRERAVTIVCRNPSPPCPDTLPPMIEIH